MASFVLVHGGYGGGWQWRDIAARLRAAGHDALTPTLTGLGERAHLAHPGVDLQLHIDDILNVLVYEDLRDVLLVGHSYGGMVITGVAERVPERLHGLVYLDAFVPNDGESMVDIVRQTLGPEFVAQIEAQVRSQGDGWRLPAPPVESDGMLNPGATAQSYATFSQSLAVRNPDAAVLPHCFILCTERPPDWPFGSTLALCAERARAAGWPSYVLSTGHALWRTAPQQTADLLLTLV